jgi:predicted O-methyltransferase YrrM
LNKADRILRQIEKRAKSEFLPIVGPEKGYILAEEIRKTKPKHVLEVGTPQIMRGNRIERLMTFFSKVN